MSFQQRRKSYCTPTGSGTYSVLYNKGDAFMLRLSKLANYSVVILATLARQPGEQVTAAQLCRNGRCYPCQPSAKLLEKASEVGACRGHAWRGGWLSSGEDAGNHYRCQHH